MKTLDEFECDCWKLRELAREISEAMTSRYSPLQPTEYADLEEVSRLIDGILARKRVAA